MEHGRTAAAPSPNLTYILKNNSTVMSKASSMILFPADKNYRKRKIVDGKVVVDAKREAAYQQRKDA